VLTPVLISPASACAPSLPPLALLELAEAAAAASLAVVLLLTAAHSTVDLRCCLPSCCFPEFFISPTIMSKGVSLSMVSLSAMSNSLLSPSGEPTCRSIFSRLMHVVGGGNMRSCSKERKGEIWSAAQNMFNRDWLKEVR